MDPAQDFQVFFARPPNNTIEAILLPGKTVEPRSIGLAYRMVGPRAVMAAEIGENWCGVLVCTPEFAKAHKGTPARARPEHYVFALFS